MTPTHCDHERIVGWCPICPLEAEIETLKKVNADLRAALVRAHHGLNRVRQKYTMKGIKDEK
tara:strand:- start:569 stop:754 length:186 start_codon:yes stop_codon:yes gene_type:complete